MDRRTTIIMVIDDDPIVLGVVQSRLQAEGFTVVTRQDAVGTLKAIQQFKPDLILLDLHMPGLSGDALAQLIRRSPSAPRSAVVIHSSEDPATLEHAVRTTGALGYIQKSGNESVFIADIHTMLSRRNRVTGDIRPLKSLLKPSGDG
ncbi:MAG: response regulator [Polyangiaceae bacterium]|nr:response regulator [Polyangiaceae bacterium]